MGAQIRYIQVVVPLKLSWNPTYSTDNPEIGIGDRVKVRITGRLMDAVVIAVDITPDIDESRIQPIEGIAKGLGRITPKEIELWKFISSYYLCTLGEVYKVASPSGKIHEEEHAAEMTERRNVIAQRRAEEAEAKKHKRLEKLQTRISSKEAELAGKHSARVMERMNGELEELKLRFAAEMSGSVTDADARKTEVSSGDVLQHCHGIDGNTTCTPYITEQIEAIKACGGRPVLVQGGMRLRREIFMALSSEILGQGKCVLYLCPENTQSREAENAAPAYGIPEEMTEGFRSSDTAAHRRKVAETIRSGRACIIFGTRAALFLPFKELGLIIIDEEQDSSYKQDSPAPRYNARDTAVMMASIHHASAILGSATPSLESLHNASTGRYGHIQTGQVRDAGVTVEIIDTTLERRKRGMKGQLSLKLIDAVNETASEGRRSMVITTWNDKSVLQQEAADFIPDAAIFSMREARMEDFSSYGLVALVHADTILGGEDFRTDEKALQMFDRFRLRCSDESRRGRFLIQTANSDHQVFKGLQDMAENGISAYELLLPEREMFGFPPFSRIVDIVIRDDRPQRLDFMSTRIMEALCSSLRPSYGMGARLQISGPIVPEAWKEDTLTRRTVRIIIRRDERLAGRKAAILDNVTRFEKKMKYVGHISIDVDPL